MSITVQKNISVSAYVKLANKQKSHLIYSSKHLWGGGKQGKLYNVKVISQQPFLMVQSRICNIK